MQSIIYIIYFDFIIVVYNMNCIIYFKCYCNFVINFRHASRLLTDNVVLGRKATDAECAALNEACSLAGVDFYFNSTATVIPTTELKRHGAVVYFMKDLPNIDPLSHAVAQVTTEVTPNKDQIQMAREMPENYQSSQDDLETKVEILSKIPGTYANVLTEQVHDCMKQGCKTISEKNHISITPKYHFDKQSLINEEKFVKKTNNMQHNHFHASADVIAKGSASNQLHLEDESTVASTTSGYTATLTSTLTVLSQDCTNNQRSKMLNLKHSREVPSVNLTNPHQKNESNIIDNRGPVLETYNHIVPPPVNTQADVLDLSVKRTQKECEPTGLNLCTLNETYRCVTKQSQSNQPINLTASAKSESVAFLNTNKPISVVDQPHLNYTVNQITGLNLTPRHLEEGSTLDFSDSTSSSQLILEQCSVQQTSSPINNTSYSTNYSPLSTVTTPRTSTTGTSIRAHFAQSQLHQLQLERYPSVSPVPMPTSPGTSTVITPSGDMQYINHDYVAQCNVVTSHAEQLQEASALTCTKVNQKTNKHTIMPLIFRGIIVACLVKDAVDGAFVLLESVSKLYFSEYKFDDLYYALTARLNVPFYELSENEESAYIYFYGLKTNRLRYNTSISLRNLARCYQSLRNMLPRKRPPRLMELKQWDQTGRDLAQQLFTEHIHEMQVEYFIYYNISHNEHYKHNVPKTGQKRSAPM